ncbi:tRNA (guanine(26)-N(2))-dimethyltransferase, mitochondrial [[Candida] railenensis]|uniref:tRNA (guanine(26)-N(2))-dimethyltransferase n=1 Tax=[Candida] railenensis TaxID=45579 RepID=A0A9P0QP43_9ASCO|nr:tRNA (guanine(26)-N(2))-dimethyltransferase, mitochondrial [[Candida] railenensis]
MSDSIRSATNSGAGAVTAAGASFNIEDYNMIEEGQAKILSLKENKVFYNPIQQFNRDLSVTAIKAWSHLYMKTKTGKRITKKRTHEESEGEVKESSSSSSDGAAATAATADAAVVESLSEASGQASKSDAPEVEITPFINILEALSATGLRAIRYGHEIPHVNTVIANDLLPEAVKSIKRNIEYNGLSEKVKANLGDAIHYMSNGKRKFHVVDLDPYGTATPFIDGAIQSINEEGLLLVTCTDAGVLAGSGYPEKCFALYGGNNFGNAAIGSEANHEAGLRLVLQMIAANAAKYKKTIEPLLSLSIDFYVRLFIRVRTSPISVKKLSSNTMLTYHCIGCGHKGNQFLGRVETRDNGTNKFMYPSGPPVNSKCEYCSSSYHVAGPMWGGPLHNEEFIDEVLKINETSDKAVYGTTERIKGMLTVARNELADPFYFNLNQISSYFKSPPIPINELCKALGNLKYNVSLTHAKKNCIKTNAPWDVILQINRQWLIKNNKETLKRCEDQLAKLEQDNGDETKILKLREKIGKLTNDIAMSPNLNENMIGYKILKNAHKLPEIEVNFLDKSEISERVNKFRKLKIVRYQENPEKNWGPKSRPDN